MTFNFIGVTSKMSPSVYSLSQEGMVAEPSNQEDPDQQMSHSSHTGLGITSYCPSLARLGTSPVIKEESAAGETVHVKTEMCEQGCDQHRDNTSMISFYNSVLICLGLIELSSDVTARFPEVFSPFIFLIDFS